MKFPVLWSGLCCCTVKCSEIIITDRHPNLLFSVCIISPNAERKIMQTNCVRKTDAVFFGGREIIRGNLTRAKSTRSIIETRSIIKPKTSCIIAPAGFLAPEGQKPEEAP